MKRVFAILALLGLSAQGPPGPVQPGPAAPASVDTTAEEPEPWPGTTAEGLAELALLARGDDLEGALALGDRLLAPTAFARWRRAVAAERDWTRRPLELCDPIFDGLGINGPGPAMRAEVLHARALVLVRRADVGEAREAFLEASELAGPGVAARELRLASVYDAGTVTLEIAEVNRLQIPEVREALGLPQAAPAPSAPGAPAAGPAGAGTDIELPDALELARVSYLMARETLVERLRADWQDADTRANLELIERRLDELDEIERQREEQEEEEEQEEDDEEQQPPEGEPNENSEGEPEGDPRPSDEQTPDRDDSEPEEAEPPPDPGEGEEQQPPPAPQEPQEDVLTREEVMRVLDLLEQIEKEAADVRAQLSRRGRRPVEKDW